ncbi:MAG: penicillin-binding transpeptidase domain-containing protein [Agathobacter sp.]|nr:penicillin-binding transpeptidase domain-containing protein [Agathobacter sp.]
MKMANKNVNSRNKNRNKEYSVITYFFFALFVALMVYFAYFQIVKSEEFINSPYNSLQDLFSKRVVRGKIVSSDGEVLAETKVDSNGNETRSYPKGRVYSHVVGYSIKGKSGLENTANFNLLRSHQFVLEQIANDISDKKNIGDNVVTTLDNRLQNVAYSALGDYDGAAIVMQPSTGKILAMVSKPDYDPNTLSQNWETVSGEGSTALLNRATQGKYTPGSVFKIFTALEYYKEHPNDYEDYSYTCTGSITNEGHTIRCAGNEVHGTVNLAQSFAESCNGSFSNIGLEINNNKLNELCNSMLFNKSLPVGFESTKSTFSLSKSDADALTMQTCIGQGNTLVSPLHMVMVSSAICNNGVLMRPYLVDHVESHTGNIVEEYTPKQYGSLITKGESKFLQGLMRDVVTEGTGSKLAGQSYDAYGKTGTAQISDVSDTTNAWFVGYAKKKGYEDIAIAVVVEKSGTGSGYAVPVAKAVFDTYFN